MTTITTRSGKGSPLTNDEVDANFTNLNTDKAELSGASFTGNVSFGDNDKAIFGAGSDLQIYHDASNSYISDVGTGKLILKSNGTATLIQDSAGGAQAEFHASNKTVKLFNNNALKLATTSTGIDVTGTVTADGLTVNSGTANNVATFTSTDAYSLIKFEDNGTTTETTLGAYNNDMVFRVNASEAMRITSGNVGIGTSSPARLLHVNSGTENLVARFESTDTATAIEFKDSTGTVTLETRNDFRFKSGSTINAIIDSSGNVGIGASSPSTTLEVTGTGDAETGITATHARSGVGYTLLLNNTNNGANKGSGIKWKSGGFDTGAIITRSDATAASGDAPAYMTFHTSSDGSEDLAERMRIDSSGNVGIGTDSPRNDANFKTLQIGDSSTAASQLVLDDNDSSGPWRIISNLSLIINDDTDERMRIDSSGNVGIGTSSPSTLLHVKSTTAATATIEAGGGGDAVLDIKAAEASGGESIIRFSDSVSGVGFITYAQNDGGSDYMRFGTASTERMRIDASGNLLVGVTSAQDFTSTTTSGHTLYGGTANVALHSRSGANALAVQRTTNDGALVNFFKDTTAVGSIGVSAGSIAFGQSNTAIGAFNTDRILFPATASGAVQDNAIDLGYSNGRFKELYLSGTVHTNQLRLKNGSTTTAGLFHEKDVVGSGTSTNPSFFAETGKSINFMVNGSVTKAAILDASGNLLVGKTDTGIGTQGVFFGPNYSHITSTNDTPLALSRKSSDGTILDLRKDGTTVGSIGTDGGRLYIGSDDTSIFFDSGASPSLRPHGPADPDGVIDIGESGFRWKDLYLSGGVYLGGTGSANHLDDYEEGTCDLTWSDGTNHSTAVTNKYTKVGRIVTVSGYVAGNVSGLTSTAVAKIAGFPFAFSDYGSFTVKLRYIDSPTGCIGIVGDHANSGSVAQLSFIIDNGNYVDLLVSDLSTNGNDTYFNITYTAT